MAPTIITLSGGGGDSPVGPALNMRARKIKCSANACITDTLDGHSQGVLDVSEHRGRGLRGDPHAERSNA